MTFNYVTRVVKGVQQLDHDTRTVSRRQTRDQRKSSTEEMQVVANTGKW